MPKPRKPLRLTYNPPTRPGWYAYRHCEGELEAVKLTQDDVDNAQGRFEVSLLLDIPFVDVWSTRKLKKRERCEEPRAAVYPYRPRNDSMSAA